MRFRVLGPVEVADDERRLTVGSAHQRVMLAVLLAARGDIVSAEGLIDAVWGDRPPASARKSLHSHVSRLRRALAGSDGHPDDTDAVVTETYGYRVDLQRHELDADRFEALSGHGRRGGDDDPAQVVRLLDEALGLWRGPAFGELASHESVRAEAVRLDELRASALADRIDARLALGEHHAVIAELHAAVSADPLAERPHRQLMLAQYRSGRQADALATYRELRRRLGDEVGIDPSAAATQLHERMLRQDPGLAPSPPRAIQVEPTTSDDLPRSPPAVAGSPGGATPGGRRHYGRIVGRVEDVAEVARLVSTSSLVTLTGPGGVGKSTLAEAVVDEVGAAFGDGVTRCALAGVRHAASVAAALVDALGFQQQGDRSAEELAISGLGTRHVLLVLDSCEHLLAAVAPLVQRIRDRCPNVAVLATSREYLRLPGERVREVTPLPVPRSGADAAEVAATPAGALFCARAGQVEPSFALTEGNAPTVAQLCRRLDGIPLAIELAAARVRALSLEALAKRIDHRFDVLTGGSHRDADRHRTLEAAVRWSYELLTEAEARLFARLSVFAGPFPLEAAEQVAAGQGVRPKEVAGLLAELVDKSLVSVDRAGGEVRYRLLDTLRAYGAERLDEAGETESYRREHSVYHVRLVEQLAPEVRGAEERAALAQLGAALDDLRVAHAWLMDGGDVESALRLPAALADDLVFRPREEVFAWAERALELPRAAECTAYPGAMAVAARGAMNRGELEVARGLAEAALDAAGNDSLAGLSALYVLTTVALYEGHLDEALELADRRVALADALAQDFDRALAGVSRALALVYRGRTQDAAAAAAEAREDGEASGSLTARAWTLYGLGEALLDIDPDRATTLLEQAVAAARRVDRRFIEGVALVSLASLCGRRGQTDQALALFRETIAHWRSLGVYAQQLTTLRNLVELLVRVGADESAAILHGAVTVGTTPSFGTEADRLTAAWHLLEERLGADGARAAADQGRRLTATGMVDRALDELEALVGAVAPSGDRAGAGRVDRSLTGELRGP